MFLINAVNVEDAHGEHHLVKNQVTVILDIVNNKDMKESIISLKFPTSVQRLGIIGAGIAAILSKEIVAQLKVRCVSLTANKEYSSYMQCSFVDQQSIGDIVIL